MTVSGLTTLTNASTTLLSISGNSYLGTVSSGIWNGSTISIPYGGTGLTSATAGYALIGYSDSALQATSSLFVSPAGKVGIGTSSPSYVLDVAPASGFTGNLFRVASSTVAGSGMVILNNGNVGIGTTTPNQLLTIVGTRPSIKLSDYSAGQDLKNWTFSSMGGNLYIGTSTDSYATSTPPALTILNNGYVGIGTASPNHKLQIVDGNSSAWFSKNLSSAEATTLYFNNTSGDNTSSELQFQIDNTPKWTLGMDYQNADYVLAYDFSIHGDVLRLSPGGNMILGAVIGSPSAQNSIFTIQEPSNRGGLLILSATSTIPAITVEPLGLVKDALQIYKSNDTDRGYINWYQPSAGYGWRLGMLSNPYDFAIYQYTGFSNSPATPGTDVFHITSGGNIGMGTTSPLARLDVAGANNGTAPLFQLSSVASYATTTQFMVTNLGKVGIGTSNPLSKLHLIVGNSDGIAVAQSAFPTVYQFFGGIDASGSGQLTLKTAGASQNVQLLASGVSYLNGGNVGIGTTSPQALLTVGSSTPAYLAASEKYNSLFVSGLMEVGGSGTSTIANNLYVAGTLRSTASYIGDLFFANQFSITESSLDNPIQELIFKNQKGEEILKLDENGNLTIKGSINNTPTENSSFGIFGDIVQLIKDGLSKLTGVIQVAGEWVFDKIRANTIETQNIQTENGITTKDETSGDYYCIKVKDGQVTSQKGKCGDQNLQNAELPSLSPSSSSDESSSTPPVGASTSSESSTLQGESSE